MNSLGLAQRKAKLIKLREIIKLHEVGICEALKKDLGKSPFEAYATEIGILLEEIKFTLKHLDEWAKPRKIKTPFSLFPGKSTIYPEPYGTVLILSPWNYPFQLCISPLIGAIAAGNKVVIKPSEFTPHTNYILQSVLEKVFDRSEVELTEGGIDETQSLLKQKFDYIFFTGSTMVGKIIMKAAAEHLTPVTLELGGKSPLLIESSANIELAAKRCAWGKFINAGQTCVAPDYVLVPKALQDLFIERVKYHIQAFYGLDIKASPDYSRIINERHLTRLERLIDQSKIAFGGKVIKEEKYLEPTILKNVSWDDAVMGDEIFGPILPVIPYDSLDDTLNRLKRLPKPLAFYLFSEDKNVKKKILADMPFGGGCVNDTLVHLANPYLPFGGVGPSGIGSYHGQKSFETFTHYKSVFKQSTTVDIPVRYPPYTGKLKWLKFFLG